MVTFISAFLGLVLGVQPVELAVGVDVAAVELRLDGKSLGFLRGEPWVLACDFGPELAPHELVAIAFDDQGRELDRASRWLNLPQPRSQAELLLDGDGTEARVVWRSADGTAPDAWEIRFDGKVLEVEDPAAFELPDYEPDDLHFLQAELQFGRSTAHTERIVGGQAGDVVNTGLTAFVVALDQGKPPSIETMEGWLTKDGEPLEVVSIERGGSDIVVVQEATPRLWSQLRKVRREALKVSNRSFITDRLTTGLNRDDQLRVMLPVGQRVETAAMEQFHISFDFAAIKQAPSSHGVVQAVVAGPTARGLLATFPYPPEGALREDAPRRVADAVAVAAQAVSAARRTRAVVLVKGAGTEDLSQHSRAVVRRYLERLQVPLVVWSPEPSGPDTRDADDWGAVQEIATARQLQRAVIHLREVLDRQWVIWVKGRHLPHQIQLSPVAQQRFSKVGADGVPLPDRVEPTDLEPWIADHELPETEAANDQPTPEMNVAVADPSPEPELTTIAESVDVRLVNVQAVVSDSEGRRIRDLTSDDFEVYVDGQPVDISHFVPPAPGVAPESGRDHEPGSPVVDATEPSAARLVIFFDGLNLDLRSRSRLAASLREVIGEAPSVQTMIVTYDRSLKVALPLTTDLQALTDVLSQIENGELMQPAGRDVRAELANEMPDVEDALLSANDPLAIRIAESERDALLARLRAASVALAADMRATLDAMGQLVAGLGGIEGQKILLYVGDGYEMSPAQELYEEAADTLQLNPLEMATLRSEGASLRLHGSFEAMVEHANANGVTFYNLTPNNRGSFDVVRRSRTSSTKIGSLGRLPSQRQELVKEAACMLASESGGLCQVGGSEPGRLLEQTLDDLSSSYVLAFTPEHPADDTFHTLKIKVRRPELKVRHRRGYTDRQEKNRLHDRLVAALYFDANEDQLGMTIGVGESRPADGDKPTMVPLDVRVPVERLGLLPLEQGTKLGANARLLVTTRHSSGTVTGVQEFPIAFQVTGERLQTQPPLVYSHKVHLMLEPGDTTVAIGLWDDIANIGSVLSRTVSPDNG